jgi:methylated-DNA-[protein]-cysteine S-methyltransferase
MRMPGVPAPVTRRVITDRSCGRRYFAVFETELGWVGLMRSAAGVCASTLPHPDPIAAVTALDASALDQEVDAEDFAEVCEMITAQLGGRNVAVSEVLDLSAGTNFQRQVWAAVRTIPFGQTRTYAWVASAIGSPRAAHAVGQAIGRNPLPLIVPCHRVVAAHGSIGGFGRGPQAITMKRSLLRREGVRFPGPVVELQPTSSTFPLALAHHAQGGR